MARSVASQLPSTSNVNDHKIDGIDPAGLTILLIGNYEPDRQESMKRFATLLQTLLGQRRIHVEAICPKARLRRFGAVPGGLRKWLGYIDKYLLFPFSLRRRVALLRRAASNPGASKLIVHICDHSNSVYIRCCDQVPVVVTCHDLLAVRGAFGDRNAYCPASRFGRMLQRCILASLNHADAIACVSSLTKMDVERLVESSKARVSLVPNGLNHPFEVLPEEECSRRLAALKLQDRCFLLHVGSNLQRKNRDGVLRIFAKIQSRWGGILVFAGQPLTSNLQDLARKLGIESRIVEVSKPAADVLEALYNKAFALLFPSRSEGFGWPVIEAQACGCPVVSVDREPLVETAGGAALLRPLEDEAGLAEAVLSLTNPVIREECVHRGFENARLFSAEKMIGKYVEIYKSLVSA